MPPDQSPRFILGTGRCGSTILSKMLDVHPDVCVLSEFLVAPDCCGACRLEQGRSNQG